jgi:hypothetical protein
MYYRYRGAVDGVHDRGHMIGVLNGGGLPKWYNLAPQLTSLNRGIVVGAAGGVGTWPEYENDIKTGVRSHTTDAEIIIFLHYDLCDKNEASKPGVVWKPDMFKFCTRYLDTGEILAAGARWTFKNFPNV